MSAQPEARIYELERDANDREVWNMIFALPGRFKAEVALVRWSSDEEPEPGTYGCRDYLDRWRTASWDGERLAA